MSSCRSWREDVYLVIMYSHKSILPDFTHSLASESKWVNDEELLAATETRLFNNISGGSSRSESRCCCSIIYIRTGGCVTI